MPTDLEDRGRALENEYFKRKEHELIEKMKAKIVGAAAGERNVKCPKCGGSLRETEFENVKIDVCEKCSGVWLDAGELAQIVDQDKENGWFSRLVG